MMSVDRIEPRQAKHDVDSGDALLVCAYDDPSKFEKYHLESAIPLDDLQSSERNLWAERELIFYCA